MTAVLRINSTHRKIMDLRDGLFMHGLEHLLVNLFQSTIVFVLFLVLPFLTSLSTQFEHGGSSSSSLAYDEKLIPHFYATPQFNNSEDLSPSSAASAAMMESSSIGQPIIPTMNRKLELKLINSYNQKKKRRILFSKVQTQELEDRFQTTELPVGSGKGTLGQHSGTEAKPGEWE